MRLKATIFMILCTVCLGFGSQKAGKKSIIVLKDPVTRYEENKGKTAATVLSRFLKALDSAKENDIRELTTTEYFTLLYNFGGWDSYQGTWPSEFEVLEIKEEKNSIILTVVGISPGSKEAVTDQFTIVQDKGKLKITNGGQAWISEYLKYVFGPHE